jgi:nucleoside-diphosphate-sugar epimerase
MKVLVLGGAGYSGSVLVRELLARGDNVTVVDNFWFGDWLGDSPALTKIVADVRNPNLFPMEPFDSIIHLANIANDPGVELSPVLSWEVNALASQQIAEWAISANIPQIVYASSGSVYGVKSEERVTEELSLVPLTAYNKTKMVAERVLLSYRDSIAVHIVRPATICGVSPRMRFDLTVNMLTLQAFQNQKITVFGGAQIRPNVHISDIVGVYLHFLDCPHLPPGFYNAGFENLSVTEIAELIHQKLGGSIDVSSSNDPRSYRLNSQKLVDSGFRPRYGVKNAIDDVAALLSTGFSSNRVEWLTVPALKAAGVIDA